MEQKIKVCLEEKTNDRKTKKTVIDKYVKIWEK